MKILITGGAGFVGSSLASAFRQAHPTAEITAVDNLRRRGSELNIPRLRSQGVRFEHGDIRNRSDLFDLPGKYDLLIEASAEPSVHAGADGSPNYVLDTNLTGTLNCLEFARQRCGALLFLSTSRVYSLAPLKGIPLEEQAERFEIKASAAGPGLSALGVAENFPTHLPRSFYGATKLASELIVQEYADTYQFPALINRCGVIAGPGQFGKADQGVFTLWLAHHYFGKPLQYKGFGGKGKQVRDLLHPQDLFELLQKQLTKREAWRGEVYNVGGGREISVSLLEWTKICREATGRETEVSGSSASAHVDVPLFLSDARAVMRAFDWKPHRDARAIARETVAWILANETELKRLFV